MDESFLSTAIKLAIVEVLDRDGHSRATVPVWRWPVTLGRAVDCDVVLDDEHTAALHAIVTEAEGTLRLRVGETVNGVRLGGRRLAAHESAELSSAAVFQIGATRLRVRRLSDALAPERPLAPEPAPGRIPIAVLAPAFVAWNLGDHWVNTDPGQRFTEYLPPLLGPLLLVAIWSGLWAVGSKLVTHRFHYWRHARIAFSYSLAASFVGVLLPIVAFSSGWSFPSRVSGLAMAAVAAAVPPSPARDRRRHGLHPRGLAVSDSQLSGAGPRLRRAVRDGAATAGLSSCTHDTDRQVRRRNAPAEGRARRACCGGRGRDRGCPPGAMTTARSRSRPPSSSSVGTPVAFG